MILAPKSQLLLIRNFHKKYSKKYLELNSVYFKNKITLAPFKNIFNSSKLEKYSEINFYWLERFERLLEIYDLTFDQGFEINDDDLDYLMKLWEQTELYSAFVKEASKTSILDSSKKLFHKEQSKLIEIFDVCILGNKADKKFKPISEMGGYANSKIKIYPLDQFYYHYRNNRDLAHKNRIINALNTIHKYHPVGLNLIKNFTSNIIATDECGIVSYSMQQLPGFSVINLYERDDVDLMDDLLHENGHHFLNTYLNQYELIYEDGDKIFYSPWRRSLRPIRGIYHAVFTFFFALDLFDNLIINSENDKFFSVKQINKITFRFCEEFLMLKYCFKDLEYAYKHRKISAQGKTVIDEIITLTLQKKSRFKKRLISLSKKDQKLIINLQMALEKNSKLTKQLQKELSTN